MKTQNNVQKRKPRRNGNDKKKSKPQNNVDNATPNVPPPLRKHAKRLNASKTRKSGRGYVRKPRRHPRCPRAPRAGGERVWLRRRAVGLLLPPPPPLLLAARPCVRRVRRRRLYLRRAHPRLLVPPVVDGVNGWRTRRNWHRLLLLVSSRPPRPTSHYLKPRKTRTDSRRYQRRKCGGPDGSKIRLERTQAAPSLRTFTITTTITFFFGLFDYYSLFLHDVIHA